VELAFDVVGKIGRIELVPVVVVELVELEQVLERVLERVLEQVLVVVVDKFQLVQPVVGLVERVLVVGRQLVVLVPVEIVEQVSLAQAQVVGR
jgi:hypothetical protein